VQVGLPVVTANDGVGNPGFYRFADIDPGNYYVVFVAPAGQVFTTRFAGAVGVDSNVDSTGRSNTFTLASGVNDFSIDAGLRPIDLSLTKSVSNANPQLGTNVTFTVSVSNASGFSNATGVTVKDTLPSGLSYVSDNSGGSYNSSTGIWTIGSLVSGASATLQIVATASTGGTKTNLAQVQTANVPDVDSTPGNAPSVHEDDDAAVTVVVSTVVVGIDVQKTVRVDRPGVCVPGSLGAVDNNGDGFVDGGVQLGNLSKYLFFIANGSNDANWQGASKGFAGDVVVDGIQAKERTSGTVPFAGNLITNDTTLSSWQAIVDKNTGQATRQTGQLALVAGLKAELAAAFSQINRLAATSGFTSVSATSLNGLNTQDGINRTYVINVTSGFEVSTKINVRGDSGDVYVLRWDSDANFADGYEGLVKFKSGGAIVPLGGLTAGNFIHVAGDITASGGGSNPASPYPQGPRLNNGTGALIANGDDFSGGGFFTGYWLTTGAPTASNNALVSGGKTSPFSNAIFVGGWYSLSDSYSMTSGTSGVHACVNDAAITFNPQNVGSHLESAKIGDKLVYSFKVTNTSAVALTNLTIRDNNATPFLPSDDFTPAQVLLGANNFGDTNRNSVFDAGESWYFQTGQSATTSGTRTNVVSVTAVGASLAVSDTDSATVVIAAASPAALARAALSPAALSPAPISVNPNFNVANPTDVNNDGVTSPLDALLVINRLNAQRAGQNQALTDTPVYDDVNNDRITSPLDALLVLNSLNSARRLQVQVAEGESDRGTDQFFSDYNDQFADIFAVRTTIKSKRSV
jgi:uncharacterized repeat protein (TIGR01451 family)